MNHPSITLMALSASITFAAHNGTIKEYRYTDPSTWRAVEGLIGQLMINHQSIKDMHTIAIVAFHLIWQVKDFTLAQKLLDQLHQNNYSCKNMIHYLQGKLYYFQANFPKALASYAHIDFDAKDEKAALSTMLKIIGSYNKPDPDGIELDLLQAIIINEIANIHLEQQAYDEAITGFNAAFTLQKKAYRTIEHANVAYTLRRLGITYAKKGDIINAKAAFNKSLNICKAVYKELDHPELHAVLECLQKLECN